MNVLYLFILVTLFSGPILELQVILFNNVFISNSILFSIIALLVVFFCINNILKNRKIQFSINSVLALLSLFWFLFSIFFYDYRITATLGIIGFLILYFLLSITKFETNALNKVNIHIYKLISIFFTIIASSLLLFGVLQSYLNLPIINLKLGINDSGGIHTINSSFFVFFGRTIEKKWIILGEPTVKLRAVSMYQTALDLGGLAIFSFSYFYSCYKNEKLKRGRKIFFFILSFFSILGGVSSHTRAIYLGFLCVFLYFFVTNSKILSTKGKIFSLIWGLVIQLIIFLSSILFALHHINNNNLASLDVRISTWKLVINELTAHLNLFLMGTGFIEGGKNNILLDNTFFAIFLFTGFVGLLLIFCIFIYLMIRSVNMLLIFQQHNFINNFDRAAIAFLFVFPILSCYNNYMPRLYIFFILPCFFISKAKNLYRNIKISHGFVESI